MTGLTVTPAMIARVARIEAEVASTVAGRPEDIDELLSRNIEQGEFARDLPAPDEIGFRELLTHHRVVSRELREKQGQVTWLEGTLRHRDRYIRRLEKVIERYEETLTYRAVEAHPGAAAHRHGEGGLRRQVDRPGRPATRRTEQGPTAGGPRPQVTSGGGGPGEPLGHHHVRRRGAPPSAPRARPVGPGSRSRVAPATSTTIGTSASLASTSVAHHRSQKRCGSIAPWGRHRDATARGNRLTTQFGVDGVGRLARRRRYTSPAGPGTGGPEGTTQQTTLPSRGRSARLPRQRWSTRASMTSGCSRTARESRSARVSIRCCCRRRP